MKVPLIGALDKRGTEDEEGGRRGAEGGPGRAGGSARGTLKPLGLFDGAAEGEYVIDAHTEMERSKKKDPLAWNK